MQVWRCLRRWSMTFWITLCTTPSYASVRRCIKILHVLHFCTLDSLLNCDPDFVVNWIEVSDVRRPQIWKFIGVTTISEIIALLEWRQQMMHKLLDKHSMRKRKRPKIYKNWYWRGIATYITKSLQTSGKLIILFISSRRTSRNRC